MYCFITLSAVTIMNMLIAILCEVITAVADAEKEALQVSITTEVLQTCLSAGADQNNDGCIDLQEFHSMLQNQQVRKVLHEVDVDVQTLVNFADVLFEDDEGTTQPQLPFADFMQRLLQLRGRNTATVKAPQVFEEHFLNRDVFFDDESNARNRLVDMQSFTVVSLEFKIWQSAVKESISVFAKRCSDTRNNILTNPSFLDG
eukprot:s630_g10.t1